MKGSGFTEFIGQFGFTLGLLGYRAGGYRVSRPRIVYSFIGLITEPSRVQGLGFVGCY